MGDTLVQKVGCCEYYGEGLAGESQMPRKASEGSSKQEAGVWTTGGKEGKKKARVAAELQVKKLKQRKFSEQATHSAITDQDALIALLARKGQARPGQTVRVERRNYRLGSKARSNNAYYIYSTQTTPCVAPASWTVMLHASVGAMQ
jgi:hypothetical protein